MYNLLMAKTKQTRRLEKRDWAIIFLFIVVIVSNFWWWSINTVRDQVEQEQQVLNSIQGLTNLKLKTCIDEGTKPCDTTINFQQ